jgi:hypothetical protein
MKRDSRAPLIVAIVLLLLPVLYVGSYFALAMPPINQDRANQRANSGRGNYGWRIGWTSPLAAQFYWPLEQLDGKVRPGFWKYGGKDWATVD